MCCSVLQSLTACCSADRTTSNCCRQVQLNPTYMRCSVLQCVAVCCRVTVHMASSPPIAPSIHVHCCNILPRVTVRYSALQCVAVRCSAMHGIALHCTTICCSVLQCVAVRCIPPPIAPNNTRVSQGRYIKCLESSHELYRRVLSRTISSDTRICASHRLHQIFRVFPRTLSSSAVTNSQSVLTHSLIE